MRVSTATPHRLCLPTVHREDNVRRETTSIRRTTINCKSTWFGIYRCDSVQLSITFMYLLMNFVYLELWADILSTAIRLWQSAAHRYESTLHLHTYFFFVVSPSYTATVILKSNRVCNRSILWSARLLCKTSQCVLKICLQHI